MMNDNENLNEELPKEALLQQAHNSMDKMIIFICGFGLGVLLMKILAWCGI